MTVFAGNISDFNFTEVSENDIPNIVTGYAVGTCEGTTAYSAPSGWSVTSCMEMPAGSHGAASPNDPVVLVFCQPNVSIIQVDGTKSSLFSQMGGYPGVALVGIAGVALLGGYIYLARKNAKK